MLGTNLAEFQGCIRLINGTLIKIHKPWNDGCPQGLVQWVKEDLLNEQHRGYYH
jgi:hypothetical protein